MTNNNRPVIFNLLHSNARGGIEEMTVHYAHILNTLGYRVINFLQPDSPSCAPLQRIGTEVQTLPVRCYYDLKAAHQLNRLIRTYHPCALISHKGRSHSIIAHWQRGWRWRQRNYPVSIGVSHGCLKRTRHFDAMICVSRYLIEALHQQHYTRPSYHLPNFLPDPLPIIKPPPARTFTLGILSRLSAEKNIPLALDALARYRQQHPHTPIALNIAGEGNEYTHIKTRIAELNLTPYTTITGWQHDKSTWFAHIDALLLPSRQESFGLIILEAFAHRVPVIASDIQGPHEIITHQYDGLLHPDNDAASLTACIAAIADAPDLRRRLSDNAFTTLNQRYRSQQAQQNLQHILCACLPETARPQSLLPPT